MFSSLSLLLVDDDTDFIELIAQRLSRKGATVRVCTDAAAALEALNDSRPDLIMLDRKIGFDNGVELARRLRLLEPSLPIVMLSGYSETETIAEALNAGVTRYLTKPLSLMALETALLDISLASGRKASVQCA